MNDLTTFTSAALLIAMLYTGQNLIRYARAKDGNGVLGIVLAVALGIVAVWVSAQADVTAGLVLVKGGGPLGSLNGGSLVLLGTALGTGGSAFSDFLKARDNNDSAAKPKLIDSE